MTTRERQTGHPDTIPVRSAATGQTSATVGVPAAPARVVLTVDEIADLAEQFVERAEWLEFDRLIEELAPYTPVHGTHAIEIFANVQLWCGLDVAVAMALRDLLNDERILAILTSPRAYGIDERPAPSTHHRRPKRLVAGVRPRTFPRWSISTGVGEADLKRPMWLPVSLRPLGAPWVGRLRPPFTMRELLPWEQAIVRSRQERAAPVASSSRNASLGNASRTGGRVADRSALQREDRP